MHIVVDLDAVDGADQIAAGLTDAVEGSFAQGGQTIVLLTVILVLALGSQLIVAIHRCGEGVLGQAQLVGQLLHGVGLHDVTLVLQIGVHALDVLNGEHRSGAVRMRVQTAAAVGGKVLHILGVLAVPHSAVGVVGLAGCSVQHQIVRHVLVHEALTVQVHLQERLAIQNSAPSLALPYSPVWSGLMAPRSKIMEVWVWSMMAPAHRQALIPSPLAPGLE